MNTRARTKEKNIKVAYVAHSDLFSSRANVGQKLKMCEAFSDTGFDVELVVPRVKKSKNILFDSYDIDTKFPIRNIFSQSSSIYYQLPGNFFKRFERRIFLRKAASFLNARQDTIVYTRDKRSGDYFSRFVLEVHNLSNSLAPAENETFRKALLIVCISHGLSDRLINFGVPESKIIVAADGVDLSKFTPELTRADARARVDLPKDKPIVLYAGHLYPWKGADLLCELAERMPDTLFIIVGGKAADVNRLRETYMPRNNLLLLGHQPAKAIPRFLFAADVLVIPNRGELDVSRYFTSPLKLFEYMAAGRPIVASDLPSMREVLTEESAAFFEAGNIKDLESVVKGLLQNHDWARGMASTARKVVTHYTWRNRAERIGEEIMKKLT